MWPFKKEIKYTEKEVDDIIKIIRKESFKEAIEVSLHVKTVKEAVKRIQGLVRKYGS